MASLACAVASPRPSLAPGQDVQISKGTKELGPGVCSALKTPSSAWQCGGKASLPPSLALPDRRLGEILGLGCPNQGRRSISARVTSQAAFPGHKTGAEPQGPDSVLCTGPWGSRLFWKEGSPWGCALASGIPAVPSTDQTTSQTQGGSCCRKSTGVGFGKPGHPITHWVTWGRPLPRISGPHFLLCMVIEVCVTPPQAALGCAAGKTHDWRLWLVVGPSCP